MDKDLWVLWNTETDNYPQAIKFYVNKPSLKQLHNILCGYFNFTSVESQQVLAGEQVYHISGCWLNLSQESYEYGQG